MSISAAVTLAQQLIRLNTTNPGATEGAAAHLIADRLQGAGTQIEFNELSPGRENLIVRYGEGKEGTTLCFSGHLDTVPIGNAKWTRDPFCGEVEGDRLWGRGSTDMKGGIAALVVAFERLRARGLSRPLTLLLTVSEETGCQGARSIVSKAGRVGALVIAEPTSCRVAISHKGALWLRVRVTGKSAHGSRPELGANAIDMMFGALQDTRDLIAAMRPHPVLGAATSNVGSIAGGTATNMVPDFCEATVDIRLIPGARASDVVTRLRSTLKSSISLETILALDPVETASTNPWIANAVRLAHATCRSSEMPTTASFFTDASVLGPGLNNPPIAIVGPGDPALAHQVDEWCSVDAIERTTELYEQIGLSWSEASNRHTLAKEMS